MYYHYRSIKCLIVIINFPYTPLMKYKTQTCISDVTWNYFYSRVFTQVVPLHPKYWQLEY